MDPEAHGNFAGKHLVVFGCGYVGGELARQAVARGARVSALTRNSGKAAALRHDGIETIIADLADPSWHANLPAPDFVLNAVSSGGGGIEGYRRSYFEGMKSILAWARAREFAGPLLYTSSTSVYPQDGGVQVDESAPTIARDDRAQVLVETETLLREAMNVSGVILRLAGIYGPGRINLVEQVRIGEVSGLPGHHLNLIHRDDICSAIWSAFADLSLRGSSLRTAAASHLEAFNVVDNSPSTKAEVVAWLSEKLGVPLPRFTGAPVSGRRAVTPDRIILNTKLRAFGWAPRFPSYREGYADLLFRT